MGKHKIRMISILSLAGIISSTTYSTNYFLKDFSNYKIFSERFCFFSPYILNHKSEDLFPNYFSRKEISSFFSFEDNIKESSLSKNSKDKNFYWDLFDNFYLKKDSFGDRFKEKKESIEEDNIFTNINKKFKN